MEYIKSIIDNFFYKKLEIINNKVISDDLIYAINYVIDHLDSGKIRVAEKINKKWIIHKWIKKAIFLSFLIKENKLIKYNGNKYFDKLETKFDNYDYFRFKREGFRVVPPATVRKGVYIGKNTVLMPSYINIGAYVDEGCMIDTWSTVGSCAQIGKNVHLSGGVGIGGVLEPVQSFPTIIEDNCFIGARSEIVEGVIVEENSVISMGVYIGKSTKIYDRLEDKTYYGRVPSGSVVVSGSLPSKDLNYNLYCAIIVKKVNERTKRKVEINKLLRNKIKL